MSLFQAREWFRTNIGEGDEEFSHGCCVVDNVDNSSDGCAKIITGSINGYLRLHWPQYQNQEADAVQHMVISLGLPILQLEMGRFVPRNSGSLALAVLHPRKLSVYSIQKSQSEDGLQFGLDLLYSHTLGDSIGEHFTAYNMCKGPFGGHGDGGDGICVQAMDGKLMVFEDSVHVLSRRFTSCLLPGPLTYVPKTDSFVTATSSGEVECFKFRALAEAGDSQVVSANRNLDKQNAKAMLGERTHVQEEDSSSGSKILRAEWTIKVGETVLEIRVGRISEGRGGTSLDLVVLGERSLFVLNETSGAIRSQLRLNTFPSTFCLYVRMQSAISGPTHPSVALADLPQDGHNLILANFEEQLLVYAGGRQEHVPLEGGEATLQENARVGLGPLVWSAHLETLSGCVVSVAVASFGDSAGLIVVLDETGILRLCYLGTDPPTSAVVSPSTGDLDYGDVDQEHRKIQKRIKELGGAANGDKNENGNRTKTAVVLKVFVPPVCDDSSTWAHEFINEGNEAEESNGSPLAKDGQGNFIAVTVEISLENICTLDLSNVDVMVQLPVFAVVKASSFSVPCLKRSHEMQDEESSVVFSMRVFVATEVLPESLSGVATATYFTKDGEPRYVNTPFELPLSLVCCLVPPSSRHKSMSTFKLTLTTNQGPLLLKSLFKDLVDSYLVRDSDLEESSGEKSSVTGSAGNSVMVFRHIGFSGHAHDVTILVSKTAGRYRVQTASLPALWLTTTFLAKRLSQFPSPTGRVVVSYTDDPPLKDFIAVVDKHLEARHALIESFSKLNDSSHQLRVVQKRLLAKFKDRNPSPLGQLGPLMEVAHRVVITNADAVDVAQRNLKQCANYLSSVTSLINLLITLRFNLNEAEAHVLEACLSPRIDVDQSAHSDPLAAGWQEITDAGLTHLLRTALSSKASTTATSMDNAALTIPRDSSKLQRHLTILCDRLQKGGSLIGKPNR